MLQASADQSSIVGDYQAYFYTGTPPCGGCNGEPLGDNPAAPPRRRRAARAPTTRCPRASSITAAVTARMGARSIPAGGGGLARAARVGGRHPATSVRVLGLLADSPRRPPRPARPSASFWLRPPGAGACADPAPAVGLGAGGASASANTSTTVAATTTTGSSGGMGPCSPRPSSTATETPRTAARRTCSKTPLTVAVATTVCLSCSLRPARWACVFGCYSYSADRNGVPEDGCETFTQVDANNCGTCGHVCA